MAFKRTQDFHNREKLYNFDIYPKVLVEGKKATLHLINRGYRKEFTEGKEYEIDIRGYHNGDPGNYPDSCVHGTVTAVCDKDGGFTFDYTFPKEMEYSVYVKGEEGDIYITVYCVAEDLAGRYPFCGDLHMHTYCSDGRQSPEVVSATYRSHGYDFFAITDHRRYYPSLRAIEYYKDIPTEFVIVPGEEVHLPRIGEIRPSVHIVNFGGEYSINALIEDSDAFEMGTDKKYRSIREDCPDVMTQEEYEAKMIALSKELDVPADVDAVQAATYKWIFDEIRKANGLGIFAHPTWVTGRTFHVSDAMNDYFVKNKLFDAFEVLGGERYYEHNGYQAVRYYEDKAKGYKYPIVGSTDSHTCYDYNAGALLACTLVFAPKAEKDVLIRSIKDFYSVAVDHIDENFRIVGDIRLVRYGCFLLKNYFPYHDELCFEEGRLMHQTIIGTEEEKADAVKTLACINGRMKKLRDKYFDF